MTEVFVDQLAYNLYECGILLVCENKVINKKVISACSEEEAQNRYAETYKIEVFKKDGTNI